MPQPPKDKPVWDTKPLDLFDTGYNIAVVYAGVVTPLIHSGFGTQALAPYAYTLILMYGFCGFGRCPQFLLYFPVWLGFAAYRSVTVDKRAHTRHRGYPWLACLIPGVNTAKKGRVVECFIVFFAGAWLQPHHDALGRFVMGCAAALAVVLLIDRAMIAARRRALHNARLEAQLWAHFEQGGDGWD
jgi:hypothetical protein